MEESAIGGTHCLCATRFTRTWWHLSLSSGRKGLSDRFGFPSSFSGQSNYDQWIFQFFNIFFTAFPVMWFAIFDYEHSARDFMS